MIQPSHSTRTTLHDVSLCLLCVARALHAVSESDDAPEDRRDIARIMTTNLLQYMSGGMPKHVCCN